MSLKDQLDESHDTLGRSCHGDSGRSNGVSDMSADDERPANTSDNLHIQHFQSGLNVLDPAEVGSGEDWDVCPESFHSNIIYPHSE